MGGVNVLPTIGNTFTKEKYRDMIIKCIAKPFFNKK